MENTDIGREGRYSFSNDRGRVGKRVMAGINDT